MKYVYLYITIHYFEFILALQKIFMKISDNLNYERIYSLKFFNQTH